MNNDVLMVANIELIEDRPFLVACIFVNGEQEGNIIKPYAGFKNEVINQLQDAAVMYGTANFHVVTSTKKVFQETIIDPLVNAEIKHYSETTLTRRLISQHEKELREIHELEPLKETAEKEGEAEKPQLAKWRILAIRGLNKLIKLIGGESYGYEI